MSNAMAQTVNRIPSTRALYLDILHHLLTSSLCGYIRRKLLKTDLKKLQCLINFFLHDVHGNSLRTRVNEKMGKRTAGPDTGIRLEFSVLPSRSCVLHTDQG